MSSRLTPVPLSAVAGGTSPAAGGGYATLTKDRVVRLARAMPDCQSAVLLVLTWQATVQEKLKRGNLAGRPVAGVSGGQLAKLTDRPLRTVRHALRRLAACHLVAKDAVPAGRKNAYTLPFLARDADEQIPHDDPV